MSFSLILAVAFLPAIAAPLATFAAFRALHARETGFIAVDNAAIALGQGDRALFAALARAQAKLRGLERLHHAVHECPDPRCRAADAVLEARIVALHAAASAHARLNWARTSEAARAAAAALEVSVGVSRPAEPPLVSRRCPRCALAVGWSFPVPVVSTVWALRYRDSAVRVTVRAGAGNDRWNYRLAPARAVAAEASPGEGADSRTVP